VKHISDPFSHLRGSALPHYDCAFYHPFFAKPHEKEQNKKLIAKNNKSFLLKNGGPDICGGTPILRTLSSPEARPSLHYYSISLLK